MAVHTAVKVDTELRYPSGSNRTVDYHKEFREFCEVYSDREGLLAGDVVDSLDLHGRRQAVSRILDVGSADGKLLDSVLEALHPLTPNTVCIEPSATGFRHLRETAARWGGQHSLIQASIEDYLCAVRSRETFELIICSHVHYHFKNPVEITKNLLRLLVAGGLLLIVIDSHESQLYKWLDGGLADQVMWSKQQFGAYLDGQVLSQEFKKANINFARSARQLSLSIRDLESLKNILEFIGRVKLSSPLCWPEEITSQPFPLQVDWHEAMFAIRC